MHVSFFWSFSQKYRQEKRRMDRGHLSFCDLCYSTAIGPKMLVDLLAKNKAIPFYGCALQFMVFCVFADAECLLLAVMAYDQYKVISNPLLDTVFRMSNMSLHMAGVYMVAMAGVLIHMTLAFHLCFYGSHDINHFFCDIPPLLLLSCSDTQVNKLIIFTIFGFIELSTFSGVLVSYDYIILSVLKIHSGTMLFMYVRPSPSYSLDQDKMTSLFYTLVIPMLKPVIYSLRNKDVKEALEKLKRKNWF
uniref:G-protein coupled receptors family 1 profile domain-containing protein n=1 Tax=Sus scrofa TaxID=9823 RepID=A0A4X1TXV3_PIG